MKVLQKALFLVFVLIWTMATWLHPPAFSQRILVSGTIAVGFGRLEREGPPTIAGAEGIGEASVMFRGIHGPFKARMELGFTEGPDLLEWAQHEVMWQPTDAFALTLSGSSFDLPGTEGVISVVNAPAGPLGDMEVDLDYSGLGLMDLAVTFGGITFGLAVVDSCQPECGFAVDSVDGVFNPDAARMTGIAHLLGNVGAFTYNAYASSSSGKFVDGLTLTAGKGSAVGIGLQFENESFRLAVEGSKSVIQCVPEPGDVPCVEDNEIVKGGMALVFAGFGVHYYREDDTFETLTTTTSNVDVVYLFDFDVAQIGPEYRSVSTEPPNDVKTTDTFILLGMSKDF